MNYVFLKEVIDLANEFEEMQLQSRYAAGLQGFKQWIYDEAKRSGQKNEEPAWEGKENGRSSESYINMMIVRMNRYAKMYSRAAMHGSEFSTQEEFIYLINLQALGPMTKTALIRRNIHDKTSGIQILRRLIRQGWVEQQGSETDKRSRIVRITAKGIDTLDRQMGRIRQATRMVTGNLDDEEKMELIRLLSKLDDYHLDVFNRNVAPADLLDAAANKQTSPT